MHGSCFIVRYCSRFFVITAQHVTKNFEAHQIRVQYQPSESKCVPLLRHYSIQGEESDDTDQYDIFILAVDEGKLDPALFGEYQPYNLCESEAYTFFNPTSNYATRAFPTYLRQLSYEKRSVEITSLLVDAAYVGRTGTTTGMHILKINLANQIDDFDGMSGAPVFQIRHDGPKNSYVSFAGMLLRGSSVAGTIQFLEHEKIISALTKIITNDFEPSEV